MRQSEDVLARARPAILPAAVRQARDRNLLVHKLTGVARRPDYFLNCDVRTRPALTRLHVGHHVEIGGEELRARQDDRIARLGDQPGEKAKPADKKTTGYNQPGLGEYHSLIQFNLIVPQRLVEIESVLKIFEAILLRLL